LRRTDHVASITGLDGGITSAILGLDYMIEIERSRRKILARLLLRGRQATDLPMTVMLKAATRTVLRLSPNISKGGFLLS
jgi:hypothetical protein